MASIVDSRPLAYALSDRIAWASTQLPEVHQPGSRIRIRDIQFLFQTAGWPISGERAYRIATALVEAGVLIAEPGPESQRWHRYRMADDG